MCSIKIFQNFKLSFFFFLREKKSSSMNGNTTNLRHSSDMFLFDVHNLWLHQWSSTVGCGQESLWCSHDMGEYWFFHWLVCPQCLGYTFKKIIWGFSFFFKLHDFSFERWNVFNDYALRYLKHPWVLMREKKDKHCVKSFWDLDLRTFILFSNMTNYLNRSNHKMFTTNTTIKRKKTQYEGVLFL